MKDLIKTLVEAYGPSGCEDQVRAVIRARVEAFADEITVDDMGNLIAVKRGNGSGKRIMIAAHMDEIGVIVTFVDKKGFMRFGPVGGVRTTTLIGNRVRFADGTVGVIGTEKGVRAGAAPVWEELFIDVGATSPEDAPVGVGDQACFMRTFVDMGNRLVSKAMDDRVGCAIAIEAMSQLDDSANDVYFCFTVQEEVGTRGAAVSAFGIEPDVAIALDVTLMGDTPEAPPMAIELGKGPAIKVMDSGMLAHPGVKQWMIDTAKETGLDYQLEVLRAGSTDAAAMQRSRAGVPAGCISVPTRYVHSPSEMVDYGDVQGAVKLLVSLLESQVSI